MSQKSQKWYDYIPHPVVLLLGILVFTAILSYIIPAGAYERELIDGRERVVPGSWKVMPSSPLSILDLFRAIPLGFKAASEIIFVVLSSGIMFGILEKSGMVENVVGTIVRRMGTERQNLLIVLMTFLYGMLGVLIGYENNIAMVPIAAVMTLALGGDLMLAAGVSVGAITVGFGLSPINPNTVGVGHKIAEMPLFSGAPLRSGLCFIGLSVLAYYNVRYFQRIKKNPSRSLGAGLDIKGLELSKPLNTYTISRNNAIIGLIFLGGLTIMLYGIFVHHWYINEISAIFLMISIVAGLAAKMNGRELSETALKSVAVVAPGAFMVGYATAIREAMEMAMISDTIAFSLSQALQDLPTYSSAIAMSLSQSIINLFIPSGSGQALATLPIMIPIGELLGLTRQSTILAFQIGDGVTNLFNPSLGGLIAMLSMCRVPFDRWLRFIFPLVFVLLFIAWIFLVVSVAINWGPL
ncbi:MAG: YfcC family protein [Saprospiraceae bacterium]|nr:YfcC family protein [Saprospiraceae bacterium]